MTAATWMPLDSAAELEEIAGQVVARSYGDVEGEYASLRDGALLLDRSARHRMTFSGARAAELLTGLVTNDVLTLLPGQGCYAAALTPKGKLVADLRMYALSADRFLVDAPVRASEGWTQVVRKYVNPRVAAYTDVTATTRQIGIHGTRARALLASATGVDVETLGAMTPFAHLEIPESSSEMTGALGTGTLVARNPELRLDGFEIYGTESALSGLWSRLIELGATPGGLDAFEIARVEAGQPEWGVDMDDTTIPQEANLEEAHAISFTKGCYTGQEVVARVHFRGHVNRHLRGLASLSDEALPVGAELLDVTGKVVGDVRSSVLSPRLGHIGLGMVRREVEPGQSLTVRAPTAAGKAAMVLLPFPPA